MALGGTGISGVTGNERACALLHQESSRPLVLHTRVVSQSGGGPEKTILNSPRYLVDHGYDCVCIYMRDPKDEGFRSIEQRAEAWEAPLLAVDDHGPLDVKLLQRLRALLDCWPERSLIWHGHDYKSNLLGIWFQRLFGLRLVTTVHGWVQKTWKTPLYYTIDRFCLHRYERIICVSLDLFDACLRLRVAKDRVKLIDNAIDPQQYCRKLERSEAKGMLGWPADRLLIGAVGRLSAEKAFEDLIAATEQVIDAGVDTGLVIAGGGSERERLEKRIAASRHAERIRLAGYVSNPEVYFQAMDVFALSSVREGLPNVLLEAMAYEVPVVATRIAGIPRLVEDGENGRLVDPGAIQDMANELRDLLAHEGERKRLGERAGKRSRLSFRLLGGWRKSLGFMKSCSRIRENVAGFARIQIPKGLAWYHS